MGTEGESGGLQGPFPGADRPLPPGEERGLRRAEAAVLGAVALAALFALRRVNYLLYHSAIEFLGAAVAVSVFAVGWNARAFAREPLFLVLACGSLGAGALDILHSLAYRGMGVFPGAGADLPTQLWVAGRLLQAASTLLAVLCLGRPGALRPGWLLGGVVAATAGLLGAILLGVFPSCYAEGVGLTPFKVAAEYGACAILAAAGAILWRKRALLDPSIFGLLLGYVAAAAAAELSFTLYVDVYGFFNFLGHAVKLAATACLYLALVRGALVHPYRSLFRTLAVSEEQLRTELAERRRAEEKAESANRAKGEFLANMSHEIR
ncbi:MAG: hypothetical protein IH608_11680, partial [Proteobacteria bacterium]|nr:hypothetical protein [Pseudomonadota bacterium]